MLSKSGVSFRASKPIVNIPKLCTYLVKFALKKLGLCFGFAHESTFFEIQKVGNFKIFLYVLHFFILYNPGWNEPKLISPKMQVNFFPNQNYLSQKRKKNLKSKKTDTKKLLHDSWIHGCRQELSMQQVTTNNIQRQNSDILEKSSLWTRERKHFRCDALYTFILGEGGRSGDSKTAYHK